MDAKLDYDKLYEIRLRVGRPLFLTYDGGECFLRKPGQEQYLVTTEDLKETLEYVTGYSLYAYEDEIRQGFISVQGGHRVGVTGKVVLDRGRIIGGFYSLDDTKEAEQLLLEKFKVARVISGLNEENQMEGVDKTKEIAEKKVELEKAEKKLEELRSKYKNDEAFTKFEAYRDHLHIFT